MRKNSAKKEAFKDSVLPFLLNNNIRGRFARINKSLNDILYQHQYPYDVSCLLAEALLITAMIGQAIKLRWKLSLQIRGNGWIKLIATDYYAPKKIGGKAQIRGYAKFDDRLRECTSNRPIDFLGKGLFAILIDQGVRTKPYQGITPLIGSSLSDCVQTYFEQSEQISTKIDIFFSHSKKGLARSKWSAGGIMLQRLPNEKKNTQSAEIFSNTENFKSSKEVNNGLDQSIMSWSKANFAKNNFELSELSRENLTPTDILRKLFRREAILVFNEQKLTFGCSCSKKRVSQALSIYSAKDIATMADERGNVTADCQFCGRNHILRSDKVGFERKK